MTSSRAIGVLSIGVLRVIVIPKTHVPHSFFTCCSCTRLLHSPGPLPTSLAPHPQRTNDSSMSAASTKRRASKPLMEKRRRDRINQSLAQLKELISSATASQLSSFRRNRMEKADILEMTVQYVHDLNHNSGPSPSPNTTPEQKLFVDGFLQCVNEIKTYFTENQLKFENEDNLLRHLEKCLPHIGAPEAKEMWRPW